MDTDAKIFNRIARSHMYWGRKPLAAIQDAFSGNVEKGDIVVDPLCGGGTALIAGLAEGSRVIGTDLNPMAVFISRVIVRPTSIATLKGAFEDIRVGIAERILERYTMRCLHCGARAYVDYLVWCGRGKQTKPERVKTACPKCGKSILRELSANGKRRQLHMSRMQPERWYPKTYIRGTREAPVKRHYELFTGRNLWALAELLHAIEKTSDENCRDALKYVFTGMLYSCSEMQMFSEKNASSSQGWTAYRYYVPPRRKEKNVWFAFENRFKNFVECKRKLNSSLPDVRVTDSQKVFFSNGYEALVRKADVFHLDRHLLERATHVFLDPPYNDDVDYIAFSEFWGSWLKMSFDFEAEWHPRAAKAERLQKLLNLVYRNTGQECKVTLAFGAKKTKGWDLEKCISESRYVIERSTPFFYDNSYKRGGMDRGRDRFFTLAKKESARSEGKIEQEKPSLQELQEMLPYLRVADYFFPDYGDEALRERAARLVPDRLQNALRATTRDIVRKARKSKSLSRKAYYTLCYALLKGILEIDTWEIEYTDNSQLEHNGFVCLPDNGTNARPPKVPKGVIFTARKDLRKIVFCFDEQGKTQLRKIASTVRDYDRGEYYIVCVMVVRSKNRMNRLRELSYVDNWPRGFFVCFDDIRRKYGENYPDTCLELLAPRSYFESTAEQQPSQDVASFQAKVIENFQVGGKESHHYKLRFKAPDLQDVVPGQFVMTDTGSWKRIAKGKPIVFGKVKPQVDLKRKAFLKRPFGIHRAFYPRFETDYLRNLSLPPNLATILHTARPNQFDIFYKVIRNGVGTKELTELRKGNRIQMIGPLGKRFDIRGLRNEGIEEIHVIGGGMGMAPLIFIVQALRFCAFRLKAFVGIESLELLSHKDDLAESYVTDPSDVKIYIDDLIAAGLHPKDIFVSYDKQCEPSADMQQANLYHGFVSEQYKNYLAHTHTHENGTVWAFTCGPMLMMKEIVNITQKYGIRLKVLLEKRMACGIGVCFSCVCRTKKNGKEHYSRVCVDGPVFDAKDIVW